MRALSPSIRLRAYAYGLVTTAVVLVFALAEWWAEKYVSAHSRLAGTAIEVTIVLLAALAFRPFHQRAEAALEAAFTRRRREARAALSHLQSELTSFRDVQQVLRRVVEAVDHHMSTAGCAVYLRRAAYMPEGSSFDDPLEKVEADDALVIRLRSAAAPADPRILHSAAHGHLAFPMMAGGELVGFLTLTPKRIEYNQEDRHALGALADAAAVALLALDPRLRVSHEPRTNLPQVLTSFVGRENEVAQIAALVREHRLVTLVGAGGVGKTRASLQVAADLLNDFTDGVWFIEFAPLTSGDYVSTTIAQVLGIKLPADDDPIEHLANALKGKQTLLLFDNCEHLIDRILTVTSAILHGCAQLRVVATSRTGLNVAGEHVYRMPSLSVPLAEQKLAAQLVTCGAPQLFADRAFAADSRFMLTDDNAPDVAEICRRLDGIPLAIELAAARVNMLSPKQLRERLDERFRVLTGGDRSAMPRHQTMRALIDWSYDLLDERERVLFRRLGIFVNAFPLEGAVAIGGGEDLDEMDVLDVLSSLVDKSLVMADPQGDALRYRLLESTRAYALERLDAVGERDLVAQRHLRSLRDRFEELWEQREHTARDADRFAVLQTELEDVRFALDGALARSELIDGGDLLATIDRSWRAIGLEAEGIVRCEAYLAALPAEEWRLRARLSIPLSYFFGQSGEKVRAFEVATQAVEQARAGDDALLLAAALDRYAMAATLVQRLDDAERALAEAEAIPGASAPFRINLLESRAFFSQFRGDLDTAARTFDQLRKENRALGNTRVEWLMAHSLAEVEHARGNSNQAIAIVCEILPAIRSAAGASSAADASLLPIVLHNTAGYLAAVDDLPGALNAAREAIGIRAAHGEPDHAHVAIAMEHLALVFALRGDFAPAATLEAYADAAFDRHGFTREFTEITTRDRLMALLNENLASDELARLIAEGAALTPEAAIALALEEQVRRDQ